MQVQTVTITAAGLGLQLDRKGQAKDGFAVKKVVPGGASDGAGIAAGGSCSSGWRATISPDSRTTP